MKPVYIYDAIRTPRTRASAKGALHQLTPHQLLASLYQHIEARTGLLPVQVDEVVLGCVTQHGEQAGNIAKTSSLYAGWPDAVAGLTVNRFCSSGIDAINIAALKIAAGQQRVALAGGIEMMSRVPMLSDQASVFLDPEIAARCRMLMMGNGADLIASLNHVSREQADEVALMSQQRAAHARASGYFSSIVPINNTAADTVVSQDECIRPDTSMASLAALAPAFAGGLSERADAVQLAAHPALEKITHLHTAGNSPAMADGAALLLLGDETLGVQLGIKARAKISLARSCNADVLQVLTGCVGATKLLLKDANMTVDDIDLFELHEAFAATMVMGQRELGLSIDKLNVNGGVIALGHPMGATGACMAGTLLDELERRNLQRGIVAASGAAGAGSALLLERI